MVRPVPDQSWVSKSATETTSPVALGSAVQKGRHATCSVRLRGTKGKTRHWAKVVAGSRPLVRRVEHITEDKGIN
jgi:hypothetical protein